MADRKEQLKSVYDHGAKSKAKQQEKAKPAEKSGEAAEGEPADVGSVDGRQKAERDEMQRRHETELKQLGDSHRDEGRAMNLRHEGEYGTGAEPAAEGAKA